MMAPTLIQGREQGWQEREGELKRALSRVTTHLCFFGCFHISSFLRASFSFFEGALCSLREALPSFFLLPPQVFSAEPRSRSPSSSRRPLRSACFLRGDPDPGLPPARSFWPGWALRLPGAFSAGRVRFIEGVLLDLSPARVEKK